MTIALGGAVRSVAFQPTFCRCTGPAVQVLTFYGGMSATNVEADITAWSGGWAGGWDPPTGVAVNRWGQYHTQPLPDDTDPAAALTQVNSLATASIPSLPPGTLPPVILPYDPTSATPVASSPNSKTQGESVLFDTGRYQVRSMIMASPGANAPVVYGGKVRAVLAYLDRQKLQARNLSPTDVMDALDRSNVFLPTGDAKLGEVDYALDSNSMYDLVERMGDIPIKTAPDGKMVFLRDVALPKDAVSFRRTSSAWTVAAGLHPGLSTARGQHARGGEQPAGQPT